MPPERIAVVLALVALGCSPSEPVAEPAREAARVELVPERVQPAVDVLAVGIDCAPTPVFFERGSAALDDADRMALSALAQCLKAAPDGEPWRGTELVVREPPEPFDAELASRRATNVVTFLRLSGVHGVDFEIRAVGETGATAGMPVLYPASRAVAK